MRSTFFIVLVVVLVLESGLPLWLYPRLNRLQIDFGVAKVQD